jgi:hypothetical protein
MCYRINKLFKLLLSNFTVTLTSRRPVPVKIRQWLNNAWTNRSNFLNLGKNIMPLNNASRYTFHFPIANNTVISKVYVSEVGTTLETFHRLTGLFCLLNANRILKHIVTWLSVDRRVFDWSLDSTRDYTLHLIITQRLVSSVTFLGSGFQWRTFLCFWAHVLAGWRPCRASWLQLALPSAASSRAELT